MAGCCNSKFEAKSGLATILLPRPCMSSMYDIIAEEVKQRDYWYPVPNPLNLAALTHEAAKLSASFPGANVFHSGELPCGDSRCGGNLCVKWHITKDLAVFEDLIYTRTFPLMSYYHQVSIDSTFYCIITPQIDACQLFDPASVNRLAVSRGRSGSALLLCL
jgi:hypothetical protein